MWQPDPGWHPLPGASGLSTLGVWRTDIAGRAVVVKRLCRPTAEDPPELSDPKHFGYWRRPAEVASYALVEDTPGVIGAPVGVEEDDEGITLTTDWVEDAANPGLFVSRSLARLAAADLRHVRWLARDQLRDRLARIGERGGWPTLGRTTVSDLATRLWEMRGNYLDALDELPQVLQHGDPTPANLPGREVDPARSGEHRLIAIDWACLGYGPVGADVGLYALTAREELSPLIDAYLLGLPDGLATREQVTLAARVNAVYTALSRAEWALARVADGEGALAAKFRHPAVAPHLRALQRQAAAVEALLDG